MATREEYNSCISKRMKGRQLSSEERKQAFCISAKLCSSKAKNEEEALELCSISMSQPKEKPTKARRKGKRSEEKDLMELAACMAENIDMDLASNINSVEIALANSLMACKVK